MSDLCVKSPALSRCHQWMVTRWIKDIDSDIWIADYFHCQWCMEGYSEDQEK